MNANSTIVPLYARADAGSKHNSVADVAPRPCHEDYDGGMDADRREASETVPGTNPAAPERATLQLGDEAVVPDSLGRQKTPSDLYVPESPQATTRIEPDRGAAPSPLSSPDSDSFAVFCFSLQPAANAEAAPRDDLDHSVRYIHPGLLAPGLQPDVSSQLDEQPDAEQSDAAQSDAADLESKSQEHTTLLCEDDWVQMSSVHHVSDGRLQSLCKSDDDDDDQSNESYDDGDAQLGLCYIRLHDSSDMGDLSQNSAADDNAVELSQDQQQFDDCENFGDTTILPEDYADQEDLAATAPEVHIFSSVPKTSRQLLQDIEGIVLNTIAAIVEEEVPYFEFHSRVRQQGIVFDPQVGFRVLLHNKLTKVDMFNSPRRFAVMWKVLECIFELLRRKLNTTKRDLFYLDVPLFGSQKSVDCAIDDIACLLQVSRAQLHCIASFKGLICGNLEVSFEPLDELEDQEDGEQRAFLSTQLESKLLPRDIDDITVMQTTAEFVLIVEKEAVFHRLLNDRVFDHIGDCIVITGIGYPDIQTRSFVHRLAEMCGLPMYALVDCDPHGFDILCNYKYGSRALAFDSENLTVPSLRWLGLLPSDIDKFNIQEANWLAFNQYDTGKLTSLLNAPFLTLPDLHLWREELELMQARGIKCELQALNVDGDLTFLTGRFLPHKLQSGHFLL
ncbi:meiotic recombination protein SPO11 [Capsaspora owczarzaki ATCC 30864]|uniref:DNA topoisomerase (ATP-hydrolyzing) n=1 Tax=Capsaspora owczarzaki (strain ATCC 30864) TaxID=595528 RepID=A0A0D2UJC0_CAPO3|nr:meiotic recombination protein SPO11 [Capsaspora owczarzaki ATCC 30864]KJE95181.1 meiotic recombination protein SPO11 [Capsaspora owczarzaki ATCC 30864]|eukprot:XP_004346332.1 meiotic recombination protein SPO11 [Capsaspora owczarzaki ATCC 30864]